MGDQNVKISRAKVNKCELIAATAVSALTFPASLDPTKIAPVSDALRLEGQDHDLIGVALSAVAALFYARVDLVEPALLDRLAGLVSAESVPAEVGWIAVRLFASLAPSALASQAWSRLRAILLNKRLSDRIRERLLPLVGDFVLWHEDLVGLEGILEIAESSARAADRALLLDRGVETFVFSKPEAFTPRRLERIAELFADSPRYHYVLHFLAARRSLSAEVRALLMQRLVGRFQLRTEAAAILTNCPVKIIVLMNISLGQGDEIVRLAPLLQALLDANPELAITLVTRRTYLYENPRVKTVSIDDKAAVDLAFADSFQGIIEIFQPDRPDFACRKDLHAMVERLLGKRRPPFVVQAELGRAEKGALGVSSEFLYQTVELSGRDVAHPLGLDQRLSWSANNYEPCLRLMAELDLPQRVAQEKPLSASVLAGTKSAEAERIWGELIQQEPSDPRPTVLVNPFGGASPTKGFIDQDHLLVADIGGLIDEGYLVVVLPNGTPWGRREAVLAVLSHVDPETRAFVRVAPDPAETMGSEMLELSERPDLRYPDRIMRLFKYFATYADLVVTVEGWLAHLAYNLARPFRLFLAAGSFTPDWFPYGRGPAQRLVTAFSPRCRSAHSESALLREGDPPPLPHGYRKALFELAMGGLIGEDCVATVRHALNSRDCDIRRCTIAALGRISPTTTKKDLLLALDDRSPTVMFAAAEALLEGNVDCARELGPEYKKLLRIHFDIIKQNWDAVTTAGAAAFPALFSAAKCESYVLATQARSILRQLLSPYLPAPHSKVSNPVSPQGLASHPCDALRLVLRTALTSPNSLNAASLERLHDSLCFDKDDHDECELALGTAAALLYSRPDLVDGPLIDRLADLLATRGLPESFASSVVKLFAFLATSPSAPLAWIRIAELLRSDLLEASTRECMFPLVAEYVQWREDIVGLDGILALAEVPALVPYRTQLFDQGIERFVFCAPEAFDPGRLRQIAGLFSEAPRYIHVLYSLGARSSLTRPARSWLSNELQARFPFQDSAANLLKERQVALLVVLNVGMGQGDDVVRIVPLLQGLLDANPMLSVTLVTWRTYLYDNPRIVTVPIIDEAAVHAVLNGRFEGVIEFFQPEWPDFAFRLDLHSQVQRYIDEYRPDFVIRGDAGRGCEGHVGNRLPFLYQTVKIKGTDIAQSRGLDQCTVRNMYEPTMRLLAELGLPQRAAEETPLTPAVLCGNRSADAERVWAELTSQEASSGKRPVALMNPFGGSGATKGFLEQESLLRAEISGLVDEGFMVVFLPNGQTWGRRGSIDGILSRLDASVRAKVRVAPDPVETDETQQLTLSERSELGYADRVMRLFKYFATYADLVVTVEGWLAHLAYNLARPFRLFLAAGSFSSEYHPRFRGPRQRVVPVLSEGARAASSTSALLGEGEPPPLPHCPRKSLLELALTAIGRFGDSSDAHGLRRALKSPAGEVRTWAISALGRIAPSNAKVEMLEGLQDRWPAVSREAAQALLVGGVDCRRELGPHYSDLLQAYTDIEKLDWNAVARRGTIALPALFKAADSDVYDVKHGAKRLLREMLTPFLGQRQGT
jgi:hypothetical protein